MDRRTIFLQEIFQVSDFLQMQRNAMIAIADLAQAMFGGRQTIACTLPTSTTAPQINNALPTVAGMVLTVPPMQIFQLAQTDTAWSTLTADTTPRLIQGITDGTTAITITAPSAGQFKSVLIQARLGVGTAGQPDDTTSTVVPYYPLLQMLTHASTPCTTTRIFIDPAYVLGTGYLVNTGDSILVQGVTTAGGTPTVVTAVNTGSNYIDVSPAFTVAPGLGKIVRDITPNAGLPLAGVGNSGVAQNINREFQVSITQKTATGGSPPAVPAADAGWIPLYSITGITSATTDLTGLVSVNASAPFLPGLVGVSHHFGTPGQSSKIDGDNEIVYPPVQRRGDHMTGDLYLDTPAKIHLNGGAIDFQVPVPTTPTSTSDSIYNSTDGMFVVEGAGGGAAVLNGILYLAMNRGMARVPPGGTYAQREPFWRDTDVVGAENHGKVTLSAAGNGYMLLPNGLKLAWGQTPSTDASGNTTANFAGPNVGAVYGAWACSNNGGVGVTVAYTGSTASSVSFNARICNTNGAANGATLFYFVVGK